ncbi:MAG: hypothetical protein DVB26_06360 [Verrucomicrobia bacterium]|nr:MAG: hypothetical protein DVB26_06360 [Verrucomicrobiota bacterium]
MSSPTLLQEELELQHCEQEALRLAKELEAARELPQRIAREKLDRDNTMPPLDRVSEISRIKRYEEDVATRAAVTNVLKAQTRSVLLLLTLTAAAAALIAWGLRLMHG